MQTSIKKGKDIKKPLIALIIFLTLAFLPGAETIAGGTYTTNFPLTENPISEGGKWINGQTVGLKWMNVRTTSGFAFGTESGSVNFDDSTALLTGTWGPDQTVQATVHTVSQNDSIWEEVELRLRSSLSGLSCTGYEVNFRCSKTSNAYCQIVRWNGALGDFTLIDARGGSQYGVANGDVVKATIIGSTITAYINNVQVLQVTDSTYGGGSPGMGFYLGGYYGGSPPNADYGFTSFTASDGSEGTIPPPAIVEDELVLNYGVAYGMWHYDQARGWAQVNTVHPDEMLAVDLDGDGVEELVASFSGYGLWVYREANGWSRINTVIPDAMISINLTK
jgi:hypothetical protein